MSQRPTLELADIFRQAGPRYRAQQNLPYEHHKVMRAIESCRSAALGGHLEQCGQCGFQRIAYNSCCNRHCPKCQALAREQWLQQRVDELLPAPYFHVVFTLPHALADLALQNKKLIFQILFRSSAATLLSIARDPKHLGATPGFFSILHTWGQNLLFHPHVHCVVTGGGLGPEQQWVACRQPDFFLPVRVLSQLFRRLFLDALAFAYQHNQLRLQGTLQPLRDPKAFDEFLQPLRQTDWVVYAKAPFGGPAQVIHYLGRYTHRIAISNHRLLAFADDQVTFSYKDYRSAAPQQSRPLTLSTHEFIRRFLLHVVPPGFQRIRYYGLLTNRYRAHNLALCRALLLTSTAALLPAPSACVTAAQSLIEHAARCPQCHRGVMIRLSVLIPPAPLPLFPLPVPALDSS